MGKTLETKSFAFPCEYFYHIDDGRRNHVTLRIAREYLLKAVQAFDDPEELSSLRYDGQPIPGLTRLASFRNEGELIFFILEA